MGERNHDRQLREARAHYLGALGRAQAAASALTAAAPPLDPDEEWTDQQWQAFMDAAQTFTELMDARRSWDGLRREWHPTH